MEETMDTVLDLLAQYGIEALFSILAPILVMLLHKGVKYLENKLGLEVGKEQEKKLEKLVREGIQYAEEQSQKAAKGKETNIDEITSEKKLDAAVSYVKKNAESLGLKELVDKQREVLVEKIEAKLFDMREKSKTE